jgi:peptidoglycan hydrolase-like protein with peptidoglycan-binding domain
MQNEPHVQRELEFPALAQFGKKSRAVRRLQEWLTLAGFALVIDGDLSGLCGSGLARDLLILPL